MKFRRTKYNSVFWNFVTSILILSFIGALPILIHSEKEKYNWENGSKDSISSASQSVIIENRSFSLQVHLWWDHMPLSEGLKWYIQIIPDDDLDFPEGLEATRVWLENGDVIITRFLPEEYYISHGNKLEKSLEVIDILGHTSLFAGVQNGYVQLVYQNSDSHCLVDVHVPINDVY